MAKVENLYNVELTKSERKRLFKGGTVEVHLPEGGKIILTGDGDNASVEDDASLEEIRDLMQGNADDDGGDEQQAPQGSLADDLPDELQPANTGGGASQNMQFDEDGTAPGISKE